MYIQNKYDTYKEYESVLVSGKAFVLSEEVELNNVIDKLSIKSIGFKKIIDKDGWEKWIVIKIFPDAVKYTNNSKMPVVHYIKI
jgi:hypothetical protein